MSKSQTYNFIFCLYAMPVFLTEFLLEPSEKLQ